MVGVCLDRPVGKAGAQKIGNFSTHQQKVLIIKLSFILRLQTTDTMILSCRIPDKKCTRFIGLGERFSQNSSILQFYIIFNVRRET